MGYATARGIRRFRAFVLLDNRRMLRLLERLGGTVLERRAEQGVTSVLLELPAPPGVAASASPP